jgi:hypothetical protein
MHAALQQHQGTIEITVWAPPTPSSVARIEDRPLLTAQIMSASARPARVFIIQGVTKDGRTFRPSDWAERLAGAMSCFQPGGAGKAGIGAFIGYSPYCVPTTVGQVKAVRVSEALRQIEPMAWDFVTNFARDNNLQMAEVNATPGRE